jgi:outer membrane protein assembly factor BamB
MKCLALASLAVTFTATASLRGSTGQASELAFPQGTLALSPSRQAIAISASHILVGLPGASYRATSTGPVLGGAGEVHVFSTVTGQFLRRLRPAAPAAGAAFGSVVAVQGSRAFIVERNNTVCALDINTGKTRWTTVPADDNSTFEIKNGLVTCLAVDGDNLLVGMPLAWSENLPDYGFFFKQGLGARLSCATGIRLGGFNDSPAQENAELSASVAVAGPLILCGSPGYDSGGRTNDGKVLAFLHVTGSKKPIYAPDPASEDRFGTAVAIAQNRILISSPHANVSGKTDNGKVYIYDATTLAHIKTLNPPAALGNNAQFGITMAASGPLVVIGSSSSTGGGSAWLYDVGEDKLAPLPHGATGMTTHYGRAVAIHQSSAAVIDPVAVGTNTSQGRVFRFTPLGRGRGDVEVIAATKTAASNTAPGTLYRALGDAAVSPLGKIAHLGTLTGGGTTSRTDNALWSNQDGTHSLLQQEGDLYAARTLSSPTKPFFASDGTGRFLVRYADRAEQNLFVDNGAGAYRSMGEGSSLLINGMLETVGRLHEVVSCPPASGLAAFSYSSRTGVANVTASNDSRIGRRVPNQILDEAREGTASPAPGLNYGQIAPRVASDGGRVAFVAALTGAPSTSNSALVVKTLGVNDAKVAARKGDPAPGAGNAKFSAFLSEAVNGSLLAFRASLSGGASGVTSGVWRYHTSGQAVYLKPVAVRLQQAPGCQAGTVFTRFMSLFITDNGAVAIQAKLTGKGVHAGNDTGVWVHSNDILHLLFREGDTVPGDGGSRIGVLQRFDLDKTTHYAALVSLTGASATNQALLNGHLLHANPLGWQPVLALRKGAMIDRPAPMPVKGLGLGKNHLDPTGSGSKGSAKLVNDHGTAFTATFSDTTELLFGRP